MKPDKFEKMAHKWFSNALSVGNTVEQGERDLTKLLRRVAKEAEKRGADIERYSPKIMPCFVSIKPIARKKDYSK